MSGASVCPAPWQQWMPTNFDMAIPTGGAEVWMADVNGDGLADLVGQYNVTTYVALSTGNSFRPPAVWQNQSGLPCDCSDTDGDGVADITICLGVQVEVGLGNPNRTDWSAGTTAWYYMWNQTENVITEFGENQSGPSPGASAEWIMERPYISLEEQTWFANYGTTSISSNRAVDYAGNLHNEVTTTTDILTTLNCVANGDLLSTATVTNNSTSFTWNALY
jgi:hypothetical protein